MLISETNIEVAADTIARINPNLSVREAFILGVEWFNKFTTNVWHDADKELPKEVFNQCSPKVLVLYQNEFKKDIGTAYYDYYHKMWVGIPHYGYNLKILKWLYVYP